MKENFLLVGCFVILGSAVAWGFCGNLKPKEKTAPQQEQVCENEKKTVHETEKKMVPEPECTPAQKVHKRSIVLRTFSQYFRSDNIRELRLKDGAVLIGTVKDPGRIGRKKSQIDDFYFAQEGDTIFYDGDEVLEVRFKN